MSISIKTGNIMLKSGEIITGIDNATFTTITSMEDIERIVTHLRGFGAVLFADKGEFNAPDEHDFLENARNIK